VETILPAYTDFIKLEEETLLLLENYLGQWAVLSRSAGFVKQWRSSKSGLGFCFGTYWDIDYSEKQCRIFLGATVNKEISDGNIANASYYMCVVEGTNEPHRILRKFHFDYMTACPDQRERHPRFHLQYCGRLPPQMKNLGIKDDLIIPLLPKVDGPRIFFWPMTLGLLMNIAFHEFPCDDTEQIRKRGEWQNLVRENEKMVLVPFYQRCAQLAGNRSVVFFNEAYVWPKASKS